MRDVLHRDLPILRGIADILRVRPHNVRKLRLKGMNDVARLIETEGRLREVSHAIRVRNFEGGDFFRRRNHMRDVRSLAQGSLDFVMIAMPDQYQREALPGKIDGFDVNLGHQRASGIDYLEMTRLAALPHCRRNAV